MKFLAFLISLFLLIDSSFSQNIKSKDGVDLGKRSDFMESCNSGARKKTMDVKGVEFNVADYCSCVCDELIPNLYFRDMQEAIKNENVMGLFMEQENLNIILKCLEGNYEIDENYKFNSENETELTVEIAKRHCINEILKDPEMSNWNEAMANEYCSCSLDKLYSKGYTYKDLMEIENEDSESFNEIAVPCVTQVLANHENETTTNVYDVNDISGEKEFSTVDLIDYMGHGYKVKITFNGITKYFLFDTGASDLIINKDLERELLIEGILSKESYIGTETYLMANNEMVEAQLTNVNGVTIGDYTLNNVKIAILEEGSLLCGKGFLDKFKTWELDKEKKILTLYK